MPYRTTAWLRAALLYVVIPSLTPATSAADDPYHLNNIFDIPRDSVTAAVYGYRSVLPSFVSLRTEPDDPLSERPSVIVANDQLRAHLSRIYTRLDHRRAVVTTEIMGDAYAKRRAAIDGTALDNLYTAGVFDVAAARTLTLIDGSQKYKAIPVKARYYAALKEYAEAYRALPKAESPAQSAVILASASTHISKSAPLKRSLSVGLGPVTYGMPIPRKPDDIGLDVPVYERKNYDVYWVELAVTFRELRMDDVNEVSLAITVPDNMIALELMPQRYEHQEKVTVQAGCPV